MASVRLILCSALLLAGGFLLTTIDGQSSSRSLVVPSIIANCYQNSTAFRRYQRQPMHIENLIAIIRKIEQKYPFWDMRRVARTLVRGFQFDGMRYDPSAAQPAFAYSQMPQESIKTGIIHRILPANSQDTALEEWALDNDERCALHWMLSHSLNATMRDDEEIERYGGIRSGGLRAKRASGPGMLDLETDDDPERAKRVVRQAPERRTRWPVETGVVYTKWGSISAGRVIAGITAGLEPDNEGVSYTPMSRGMGTGDGGGSNSGYPANPSTGFGTGSYPSNPSGGFPGTGANPGSYPSNPSGGFPGTGLNPGDYQSLNPQQPGWNYPNPGSAPRVPNPPPGPGYQMGYTPPNGKRKKRQIGGGIVFEPLESLYAATLAGDIGQAAILNANSLKVQSKSPPIGTWNDTICPREYTLNALPIIGEDVGKATDSWTAMTAAEVRGGMDGAILGGKIHEWDRLNVLKLSQVLEMYYSDNGFVSEPMYRACDRAALWSSVMPTNKLLEQAKSFAYVYNSEIKKIPVNDVTWDAFVNSVTLARDRLTSFASSVSSGDGPCQRRAPAYGNVEIPDRDKYTLPKTTVYAVLDHSAGSVDALREQYRFVGRLAHELDVSVRGARLGVIDGRSGQLLISPNWTDNAAILACRIVDQYPYVQSQDLVSTLRSIQSELGRLREIEHRQEYDIGVGNGIVILIFAQNRVDDSRAGDVRYLLQEIESDFGDVHTIFTSSVLNEGDFSSVMLNEPQYDFIRIRGTSQNISDEADEFVAEFKKRTHGRFYYPRCNQIDYDQSDEYKIANDIWISPGQIQYYKISPNYFYSNKDLRLRFTSDRGKVRVCSARGERYPSTLTEGNSDCRETSGTYQAPGGSSQADIEYVYKNPCNKQKRSGCEPIYISVTPTVVNTGGAAGVDCMTYGCETPDQVRVTWSHWNMRCGAFRTTFSSLTAILATLLSLFSFYKSL